MKQVGGLETQVPAFSVGGSMLKSMKASQKAELELHRRPRGQDPQGASAEAPRAEAKPKAPPKPPPGKRKPRA